MDERLKAAAKAAGIRAISFHGPPARVRHAVCEGGRPDADPLTWMGHARIVTTEIYAAFAEDQAEVAMVERAFASLPHSEENDPN